MRGVARNCVPLVAIGAQDLALRDLGPQPAHRSPVTDHLADIPDFMAGSMWVNSKITGSLSAQWTVGYWRKN